VRLSWGLVLVLAMVGAVEERALAANAVRIIDGDTIAVGGVHFRLFGIDAPEAGQPCATSTGGTWRCGDAATEMLSSLVGAELPACDERGMDAYDRVLSVCTVNGVELNATMVSSGLAWAFRRYSDDYGQQEDQARTAGLGIWQATTETPWDYRDRRWSVAVQVAPDGCPIKGNISDGGHIYHTPWSPWYSKTKISLEKGERWFCSERDALDAGWRAPIWGH